jgi:hypothetical protein
VADRFLSFVKSYAEHFKSYRRDVSEKARQYASGLMQAGSRKNIYAISEVVPDTDDRNLQQFITHSKWSAREVLDHVAHDADELIGDATDAALIIDESAFAKQGKMSVGTSRQYLGRLGKVDNGQCLSGCFSTTQYVGMGSWLNGLERSAPPRISLYDVGLRPVPRPSKVWNAAMGCLRRPAKDAQRTNRRHLDIGLSG